MSAELCTAHALVCADVTLLTCQQRNIDSRLLHIRKVEVNSNYHVVDTIIQDFIKLFAHDYSIITSHPRSSIHEDNYYFNPLMTCRSTAHTL